MYLIWERLSDHLLGNLTKEFPIPPASLQSLLLCIRVVLMVHKCSIELHLVEGLHFRLYTFGGGP